MNMTAELAAYLARAAAGDESDCPPEIDETWHACLAYPQAYEGYCLDTFGVVIDHVIDDAGKCYGHVTVQSIADIEQVSSDNAPCKGQVKT